jgi:hypothetical protein
MAPDEARQRARLDLGGIEQTKDQCRDTRGVNWIQDLIQDLRYALRRLRMARAFTSATVLTLALGIGATTSIFTLVHAVLLKSLPVANPGELYRLGKESRCCYQGGYSQEQEFSLVSYDLYKYQRLFGTSGVPVFRTAPWSPTRCHVRSCPRLSGRVRLWQLFLHVRHRSVCRAGA